MDKRILIFLLMFFFTERLNSQNTDSLKNKYNNQTIYRYGSIFLKGNERLTFKDLSREFSISDLGLASYFKARSYRITSKILNYAGLITGIASISVLANHGNRNTAFILYGGYFVLFTTSMRYSALSAQNLDRALWQRNKDVLFPARKE
jgi:hypothetical protein